MKLFSILNVAFAFAAPPTGGSGPVFHGSVSRIDAATRAEMIGSSWHRGCPVAIADLRLLRLVYLGFDDLVHRGRLIVHEGEARPIRRVFRTLFYAHYPFRRMRLVDAYGGSDDRSMAADNTSAFNCRHVGGPASPWSMHAYGKAVDVNPVENPYVQGSYVSPPAGESYVDRSRHAKGMIHDGDRVVRAFAAQGWKWGGYWTSPIDYQHFSTNGR
jgi:D-alanyl-D-alanine carboxypeptidase